MFFRKLSEQEKLERKAKRKKDRREIIKILLWYQVITSVLLGAYMLFCEIRLVKSVNYAWIVSKEVASQARFEYAISSATYETPAKDKFSLSRDSKLSHWLLNKAYERAKAKLPEDDPLLIILKFRRDTFEYKITEQNVAYYYQMCIDAIKAIQDSSIVHKDYHIGRSMITIGSLINNAKDINKLIQYAPDKYNELKRLACSRHKMIPITQIVQSNMSDKKLFAKYAVQIEANVFAENSCVMMNRLVLNKVSCNSFEVDEIVTGHNKLVEWLKRSFNNFPDYYKQDDVRGLAKELLEKFGVTTPESIKEDLVKHCPSKAKKLTSVK